MVAPLSPSFWLSSLGPFDVRPALPGSVTADVAIAGGGYTGLWTAYYLSRLDPSLRIVVLEAAYCGFGASGRNGGWCSALFPVPMPGMEAALADAVDEVGRVAAREDIDCHYAKGGTISLIRSPGQLRRARRAHPVDKTRKRHTRALTSGPPSAGVGEAAASAEGDPPLAGVGEAAGRRAQLLDADAARAVCGATGVLGGIYRPDCAALHPARLVRGLAGAVERGGVTIHENTRVRRIARGLVETDRGTVRAGVVVRALEAWTPTLPGQRRTVAPVYSLMIATEPLPAAVWERIGLRRRETFSDERRLIIYGQRTADDRLAFGGRGAPYHFGSRIRPGFDREPKVFDALARTLTEMFGIRPRITHRWGGPLGIPRDWTPSVGLSDGAGWAGGYVGDGVAAANLAGRTLADLILKRDTGRVTLPWVGHRSRRWEPEPARWLGINAALRATALRDHWDRRTSRLI